MATLKEDAAELREQVEAAIEAADEQKTAVDKVSRVHSPLDRALSLLAGASYKLERDNRVPLTKAEWEALDAASSGDFGGPLPQGHGGLAVTVQRILHMHPELNTWKGELSHGESLSQIKAGEVLGPFRDADDKQWEKIPERFDRSLQSRVKIFQKIEREGLSTLEPREAIDLLSMDVDLGRVSSMRGAEFRDKALAFVRDKEFSKLIKAIAGNSRENQPGSLVTR